MKKTILSIILMAIMLVQISTVSIYAEEQESTVKLQQAFSKLQEAFGEVFTNIKEITEDKLGELIDEVIKKFSDMEPGRWYNETVAKLTALGIISGNGDGTFNPQGTVQVDQFIKITVTALGYTDIENGKEYWASTYISKGEELGIIEPNEYDNYKRPITRAEMAQIIKRAIGDSEEYAEDIEKYIPLIKDYDTIPTKYKDDILKAFSKGIITGYTDNTFRPNDTATRAEAATIIERLLDPSKRKAPELPVVVEEPKEDFIEPEFVVERPPYGSYFVLSIKDFEELYDETYSWKTECVNYPQINVREQLIFDYWQTQYPSKEFTKKNNPSGMLFRLNRKYYTTREMQKTFKLEDGMEFIFKTILKKGEIEKEYINKVTLEIPAQ